MVVGIQTCITQKNSEVTMIEDFTNPHKGLTPIRIEDNPQYTDNRQWRIVCVTGFYHVEYHNEAFWQAWFDPYARITNHFQTLQEAENLIRQT